VGCKYTDGPAIEHRRPDVVVVEQDNKSALVVDVAVAYQNLARELQRLWEANTYIIPIVIDALGTPKPGEKPEESRDNS